jgi:hypothetical protein
MKIITANHVTVDYDISERSINALKLIINDHYHISFGPDSKEIRLISLYTKTEIADHFMGSTFFFRYHHLVDYRLAAYKGFIHTQDNIDKLADIVGSERQNTGSYTSAVKGLYAGSSRNSQSVSLGREWRRFDLDINALGRGGEFNNKLSYYWSPFSANIKTSFEVERLVCHNGMLAVSPFAIYEVPIISDWENNLNIVTVQLVDKFKHIISHRFHQMSETRASVYDVDQVNQHLKNNVSKHLKTDVNFHDFNKIQQLTNVQANLGRFYQQDVLNDAKKMKAASSHITQYDLFNMVTEISSHMADNSEDLAKLNRFANRLTFDELAQGEQLNVNSQAIILSCESDHQRAFFASAA